MPRIYDKSITVGAESIDMLGHVNNREYLRWMEEAALAHSAAQGWPTARHLASGKAWVASSHVIEYLRPAFSGDKLVLHTWVESVTGAHSTRRYAVMRERKLLVRGETRWTFVNLATGRAIDVPPEIAAAFESVSNGDAELIERGIARHRRELLRAAPSVQ
ncbi:MAG: thioesterase family protein [Burkholderiaceae bacterium]